MTDQAMTDDMMATTTPAVELASKTVEDRIRERWTLTPERVVQLADFIRGEVRDALTTAEAEAADLRRELEIAQNTVMEKTTALDYERKRTDDYVIKAHAADEKAEELQEEMQRMRESTGIPPYDDIETLTLPGMAVTPRDLVVAQRRVGDWVDKCRTMRDHASASMMATTEAD